MTLPRGLGFGFAVAVPLAVYLSTMAPTVYGVDSAELTTGAYLLGITHPPGAPAYLLLAHLFTRLPVGDVGFRVNLLSAVAGALSIGFLFAIVRRCAGGVVLAVLASWLVAFSYYIWVTAVAAEIYAVQGAFLTGAIVLALVWGERRSGSLLYGLALMLGFAIGIHLTMVLALPGFIALLAAPERRPTNRQLLVAALSFALGCCVYAYLPLRAAAPLEFNPARDYWGVDLASWGGFWWMISGEAFSRHFFEPGLADMPREIGAFGSLLWRNFLGLGALLGLPGLWAGLRDQPRLHTALLLMFVGHLLFFVSYGAADKYMMLVPAHLLWGIWVALGAAEIGSRLGSGRSHLAGGLVLAGLVGMAIYTNARRVDISDDWSARHRGETLVRALPRGAVFVGSWPDLRVVEYLRYVEGKRTDLELVDLYWPSAREGRDRWAQMLAATRPVAATECPKLEFAACEPIPGCGCQLVRRSGMLERSPDVEF
jgi:hypothetical protein